MKKYLLSIALFIITLYLVLFFDVDIKHHRLLQALWNLGHIFLFLLLSFVLYKKVLNRLKCSLFVEVFYVVILAALTGSIVEFIQSFTGRDSSVYDVVLDVVGSLTGLLLFSDKLKRSGKNFRLIIRTVVVIITIGSLYPLLTNAIDDIRQKMQFPALLLNQSRLELLRINKLNINISHVENKFSSEKGNKLLKLVFLPGRYSSAKLAAGVQDWSGYNNLIFNVYNPYTKATGMNIRIHDNAHQDSGYIFLDRFNMVLKVNQGWNRFRISLKKVKNALRGRQMNMQKIDEIIFYKSNLKSPETLYLGQMSLTR